MISLRELYAAVHAVACKGMCTDQCSELERAAIVPGVA